MSRPWRARERWLLWLPVVWLLLFPTLAAVVVVFLGLVVALWMTFTWSWSGDGAVTVAYGLAAACWVLGAGWVNGRMRRWVHAGRGEEPSAAAERPAPGVLQR